MEKIRKILALLNAAYGEHPKLVLSDPLDELVRTILSQNTNDRNSLSAFAILKKRFRVWDRLVKTDTREVARLIKHAGLANIKAARIKEALSEIRNRVTGNGLRVTGKGIKREENKGKLSLAHLAGMNTEDALEYLKSLKGVGPKTAACVLLFSFGRPVMPVDTHIFRVTKRLGLVGSNAGIEEAHERLSFIVPKPLIYDFHLCIIEHGRRTCKAQGPRCGSCVIFGMCVFNKKRFFRKKELCR